MLKDLFASLFIGVVIIEVLTGKVYDRGGIIKRKAHPLLHWICITVSVAFAIICLYGVLHDLYYWAVRL
jgi:hypothetical protein